MSAAAVMAELRTSLSGAVHSTQCYTVLHSTTPQTTQYTHHAGDGRDGRVRTLVE